MCAAAGSEIANSSWNQSNLARLRALDKDAVAGFLNQWSGNMVEPLVASGIQEFEWTDLASDGRYELLVVTATGSCCVDLTIYSQDAAGKVTSQILEGSGKLSETVRDLNGDGKDELVIWTDLAEKGSWMPMAETPRWPAVYRLADGKYIEASREFADFYDTEILPKLEVEISKAPTQEASAELILQKNKILRVLGRDPSAGLKQAFDWTSSGDPQLLQCAIATFRDVGNHEKELREAQQALPIAIKSEMAARAEKN